MKRKLVSKGGVFGRLTVTEIRRIGAIREHHCKCECGNEVIVPASKLLRGIKTSCGCLMREKQRSGNRKHGFRFSKEYHIWGTMLDRCRNPKSRGYAQYGGRGITVCERWNDFLGFYEDMGPKPFDDASIDRIDNNQGYCKENCRWANRSQQTRNTRRNRMITFRGRTQPLIDWCEQLGLHYHRTYYKLQRRNWDMEKLKLPIPQSRGD